MLHSDMSSKLKIFIILLMPFSVSAEYIESLQANFEVNTQCKPDSDICNTTVTLEKNGSVITKITSLEGPIFLSVPNKQILSCESNAIMLTDAAEIYTLNGSKVAAIKHRGFLRTCGLTKDNTLYWFLYNKIVNSKPINILVVANNSGNIAFEKELTNGGNISFIYNQTSYVIAIPEPEYPG